MFSKLRAQKMLYSSSLAGRFCPHSCFSYVDCPVAGALPAAVGSADIFKQRSESLDLASTIAADLQRLYI